jgi:hypothetical protein
MRVKAVGAVILGLDRDLGASGLGFNAPLGFDNSREGRDFAAHPPVPLLDLVDAAPASGRENPHPGKRVSIEEELKVAAPLAALGRHDHGQELDVSILTARQNLCLPSSAKNRHPLTARSACENPLGFKSGCDLLALPGEPLTPGLGLDPGILPQLPAHQSSQPDGMIEGDFFVAPSSRMCDSIHAPSKKEKPLASGPGSLQGVGVFCF